MSQRPVLYLHALRKLPGAGPLLVLVLVTAAPAQPQHSPQPGIDVLKYKIDVTLQENFAHIDGKTTVTFVAQTGIEQLWLDCTALEVDSMALDGTPTTFDHRNERLHIPLDTTDQGPAQHALEVYYHGAPEDGLYLGENQYGTWVAFADNWPNRAHYWFPCLDHPADKAAVEFHLTGPPGYETVANGLPREPELRADGRRAYVWIESRPIPTYCMVFGMAPFAVVDAGTAADIPLSYYVYPEDDASARRHFAPADAMVSYFANLIAPFPYEKLALVQSTTRYGGMENSSAIFFSEKFVAGEADITATVAHEIAHQWFGDSVTEADWHHLWLSEGFATYFSALFAEHAEGQDAFRERMAQQKQRIFDYQARVGARPIVDTTITELSKLLNANNYAKGSWVLHMLSGVLGDEAFFDGIRAFYRRFEHGTALTADFQAALEDVHGEPLDWFFRQWIWEGGYPKYEITWHWADSRLRMRIRQTQQEHIFQMPLTLAMDYGDSTRTLSFWVDEPEEHFVTVAKFAPLQVRVDPEGYVLKEVTVSRRPFEDY